MGVLQVNCLFTRGVGKLKPHTRDLKSSLPLVTSNACFPWVVSWFCSLALMIVWAVATGPETMLYVSNVWLGTFCPQDDIHTLQIFALVLKELWGQDDGGSYSYELVLYFVLTSAPRTLVTCS